MYLMGGDVGRLVCMRMTVGILWKEKVWVQTGLPEDARVHLKGGGVFDRALSLDVSCLVCVTSGMFSKKTSELQTVQ